MKARKIAVSKEVLHETFRYDPETGNLFWKIRLKGYHMEIGDEVGFVRTKGGGKGVYLEGKVLACHRVIWKMNYGEPDLSLQIDHIDGDCLNNRLENLRLVTAQQNQWNHTKAKGYYWDKRNKKYKAQIALDGKPLHLGLFSSPIDAHNAYLKAKETHHVIE